jgi:hypothetical protein
MTKEHQYTNLLIKEKSPYLLQHAHNPVDWHPWGEEAFKRAIIEDKPIFLSIGYATCHWCHVMEKESFENLDVASILNDGFISIKVDREEMPEVDQLYMNFAQVIMSTSVGWPLNVFLTPRLLPFFAATYLPPFEKAGIPGLLELLMNILDVWKGVDKGKLLDQSGQVLELFQNSLKVKGVEVPEFACVQKSLDLLLKMSDFVYGGMKGAPKFPIGYQYAFLMHYSYLENDSRPMFIVEKTLEMMYRGGIFDHLGGGFSRYSVDEQWLVPHFEKMLYDNAILAECYCDAWRATKRPFYKDVCCRILNYVMTHLYDPSGGFYSAEDADSEGVEGKFYVWTIEEIYQVLGESDAELFCQIYGVTSVGNFEGNNILHLTSSYREFAEDHQLDESELSKKIYKLRNKLYEYRNKRVHPFKDDKVLSSWNGLMIHSMLEAGLAFDEPLYVSAGLKSAEFIYHHMWKDGTLYRRYRDGSVNFRAGLSEYAFMIRASLTLFELGKGSHWLKWAMEMERILRDNFKAEGGAFYQTDGNDPYLIIRDCEFTDGAEPSGNAVHCENLLRLDLLTHDPSYKTQAKDVLMAVKDYLVRYPPGYCFHVRNLLKFYQESAPTIIIALNKNQDNRNELERLFFKHYLPHRAITWINTEDELLFELIPGARGQPAVNERTTIYICHDRVCEKPLFDLGEVEDMLNKLR